jgi:hypothetical protein
VKTDTLIDWLAKDAGAVPAGLVTRRVGLALSVGLALALVASSTRFNLVPTALMTSAPWLVKFGYTVLLAAAAAWLVALAGRPGARTERAAVAVALVVGTMALFGAVEAASHATAEERLAAWMGRSWTLCPRRVFELSLPALALCLWAARGLAPTRPTLAGAACGLLAGALGAAGYAIVCNEVAPSFIATWYTLGIVATTALGALLGRWVLRW